MFHSPSINALSLKLSNNISYTGSLEHNFSYSKIGQGEASYTNVSSLRLNVGTFLWRPWIATLQSSTAFSYTNRNSATDSTGQNITGNVNLDVFPQSKFPFRAFFNKRSNQIEGDLIDQDLTSTSYGFTQSYTIGRTVLNLDYQHLIVDDENSFSSSNTRSIEDIEDSLQLTMSTSLGNHDVNTSSRFDFNTSNFPPLNDDQMLHVLRHFYRPSNNLTVNNLFTFSDRSIEQTAGLEFEQKTIQFNSNAFWRPETQKKLFVTATSLLQGTGADLAENELGIFDSAGLSGQVSLQWNPFLNFRTLASANKTETNTTTTQELAADYTPADRELFGFRWAYNMASSISNNTDDTTSSLQDVNIRAGHIFNRTFPVAIGDINVSASQRAATILDSTGKLDRTLSHSIGSGWSKSSNNNRISVRLNLNDTRRLSNEEDEVGLQQANLQANSNYRLNRDSSLDGFITVQVNRILDDDNEFTGNQTNMASSASVVYNHRRIFGVNRLRFFSELRYISDSLFELINSDGLGDDSSNDVTWQNRLSYNIGRLLFRLTTNTGMSDGEINNFMMLQVRRDFGR